MSDTPNHNRDDLYIITIESVSPTVRSIMTNEVSQMLSEKGQKLDIQCERAFAMDKEQGMLQELRIDGIVSHRDDKQE